MDKFIAFMLLMVAALALDMLLAVCTMYLWNWLMPVIFALPTISWLQAFGLNCLITCLGSSLKLNSK